jgi:hypothetical protein
MDMGGSMKLNTIWLGHTPITFLGEDVDQCTDHNQPVCELCAAHYGHLTCHHPDHEDFCPFDAPDAA